MAEASISKVIEMVGHYITAWILFIALLGSVSEGFRCYECDHCVDPFQSKHAKTVECNGACLKITGDIMKRGCLKDVHQEDMCDKEACACSTDLCNHAHKSAVSMATLALLMTAWQIFVNF